MFKKQDIKFKQEIHINNIDIESLYNEMESVINSNNVENILDYFNNNNYGKISKENNAAHLIVKIDNSNMNEFIKIKLLQKLILPPISLSIDDKNSSGYTPLHIAITERFTLVVKFLLKNKANPNKLTFYKENALHLAVKSKIIDCEEYKEPNYIILQKNYDSLLYNKILDVLHNSISKDFVNDLKYEIIDMQNIYEKYGITFNFYENEIILINKVDEYYNDLILQLNYDNNITDDVIKYYYKIYYIYQQLYNIDEIISFNKINLNNINVEYSEIFIKDKNTKYYNDYNIYLDNELKNLYNDFKIKYSKLIAYYFEIEYNIIYDIYKNEFIIDNDNYHADILFGSTTIDDIDNITEKDYEFYYRHKKKFMICYIFNVHIKNEKLDEIIKKYIDNTYTSIPKSTHSNRTPKFKNIVEYINIYINNLTRIILNDDFFDKKKNNIIDINNILQDLYNMVDKMYLYYRLISDNKYTYPNFSFIYKSDKKNIYVVKLFDNIYSLSSEYISLYRYKFIVKKYNDIITSEVLREMIKFKNFKLKLLTILNKMFNYHIKHFMISTILNKIEEKNIHAENDGQLPDNNYFITLFLDKMYTDINFMDIKNNILYPKSKQLNSNSIFDIDIVNKILYYQDEPTIIHYNNNDRILYLSEIDDYNTKQLKCYDTKEDIIVCLLQTKQININQKDINGFTPYFYALKDGNYTIIKKFNDNIKFINFQQYKNISSFLYEYNLLSNISIPDFKNLSKLYINDLQKSNYNIYLNSDNLYINILYNYNLFINDNSYYILTYDDNSFTINEFFNIKDIKQNINFDYNELDCNSEIIQNIYKYILQINNELLKKKKKNIYEFELTNILNLLNKYLTIFRERENKNLFNNLNKLNKYNDMLISLGITSLVEILTINFYQEIYLIINNVNVHNVLNIKNIEDEINLIIYNYFKKNIINTIRIYYDIKINKFEKLERKKGIIDEYIDGLMNILNIYESELEEYDKTRIIEYIKKTLDFNLIILDNLYKWYLNIYCRFKSLQVMSESYNK